MELILVAPPAIVYVFFSLVLFCDFALFLLLVMTHIDYLCFYISLSAFLF